MTKELQLLIKLKSVSKMLGSSEGTREEMRQSIENFLHWYHSEDNSLNRKEPQKEQESSC